MNLLKIKENGPCSQKSYTVKTLCHYLHFTHEDSAQRS